MAAESSVDDELAVALASARPITTDLAARYAHNAVLSRFGPSPVAIVLGRFEIRARIGAGGSAMVYRARDPVLEREVAIKALRSDVVQADTRGSQGWLQECRALARVDHPSVVTVFEAGIEGDQPFMVMELVDGETLRGWLATAKPNWREIVRQFIAIGRGLSAIHAEGIVHRDVKPDNVLIDAQGRPKLADLGLAIGSEYNEHRSVAGTPRYMAPEHVADAVATQHSDQYSLCVALAEALAGRPPYDAGDWMTLAPAGIPRWLRRAVERGLAHDPEQRWPSVPDLVGALQAGVTRRRQWAIGGAAVLIAGTAIVGMWPLWSAGSCAVPSAAWTEERKPEVRRAMLAVDRSYANEAWTTVERRLDAYADELAVAHCAHGSADLQAQRDACLVDREQGLADLVEVLEAPNSAVVANAASIVYGLPAVESCSDPQRLASDVSLRVPERWEAVRVHSRGSRILWMRGELDGAIGAAQAAVDTAKSFRDRSLQARSMGRLGQMLGIAGRSDAAMVVWQEAYLLAIEAGDDGAAVRVSEQLGRHIGANLRRFDEGLAWIRTARAWGVRKGALPQEVSRIEEAAGGILFAAGRNEDALAAFDRALQANARAAQPAPLTEAEVLTTRGAVLASLGRLEEARTSLDKARAIMSEILGPDHPQAARPLDHLASLEHERAPEYALELGLEGLRIREAGLDAGHPDIAVSLANVAIMLESVERFDEADTLYRRAIAGMRGAGHAMLGQVLDAHASLLHTRGDLQAADARYIEANAALEAAVGSEHPLFGAMMEHWADNEAALGRHQSARAKRRHALLMLESAVGPQHPDVVRLRELVADAAPASEQ